MTETGSEPELIGVAEAAAIVGVDRRTIHRMVQRGELATASKLPGLRGAYVFNRADIDSLRERAS